MLIRSRSNTLKNRKKNVFFFFLLYIFVIEYEHSTQTEKKKIIRELKEISAMKHISDLEHKALIPNDMEINPRESMERITLMIKIKSKENSFLNS